MWSKIKDWVLAQVLWAEQNMPGKSGAEKRQAVVDRLDELIKLPFYLEWIDGPMLGWIVDYACDKLNWLTDYDFANAPAAVAQAVDAPMAAVAAAANTKDIDERLTEICNEYGIMKEVEQAFANLPEGVTVTRADDFDRCISFTLKYEGGANFTVSNGKPVLKSYAKSDKGGATIYGITWATLKTAYAQGVVKHNNICKLTLDEAKAIYRKNYWTRYGWDKLKWPVCMCCLDCCVNHGGFAWILQRALKDRGHAVTIDGKYGPETFKALLAACANPTALANAIINKRRDYFKNIVAKDASQKKFLTGWLSRCDALEKACKG